MTRARDLGDFIADGAAAELVVDTTTLVVDSTNNRVGIGTASPATALDVVGNATITVADNSDALTIVSTDADANAGPILKLRRNSASPADNDLIGAIDWTSENSDGDEHDFLNLTARMRDVTAGSEDVAYAWTAYLNGTGREIQSFVNTDASAASMVFNEDSQDIDFRVESNGNANMLFVDGGNDRVGVGTASPTGTLTVNLGTDKNVSYSGSVGEVGSVPCLFGVVDDGSSLASIGFRGTDIRFATQAAERFRFGSSGQLGIGGATYGTSGQVLTSGGSGAAPTWADAASTAITFTAQADGAIDANRMAGIESNGKMKALFNVSSGSSINVEVATAARRIQISPVTENLYFYAWDASNSSITNHNKVALVQKSTGAVSANSLTVGTIVEINSDQPRLNDAVYDPDNQRITYFWATSGSSTINYRMYSFSGTTLTQTGSGSFSVTNLSTNYPGYMEATYNTTHNCIVLIYKTTDDGAYQIQLIDPGTTSLTLSSNTYAFGNYNSYTGRSVECAATGAHVFTVQKVSDNRAYVRAGTISGSGSSLALSLGTEVDVSTSDGYGGNPPMAIFDVPENTNYTNTMCVQHAHSTSYAKYCLFSLSGTTITARTQFTPYIAAGGGDCLEGAYVKTKGFVMQTWTQSNSYKQRPIDVTAATPVETGNERTISGSVSGSHGTSRTPIANGPGSDYCVTGFVYYTGSTYPKAQAIAQVDENFDNWAGYTESAVSDGATGTFTIFGPISGVTSANPQSFLYVQDDGQVTTSSNGNGAKCGIANGGGNGIIIRSREHDLYGN